MNLNNFSKTIIEKYVKNFLRHHDLLRIVVRMPKTRKLHTNEDILLCILIWLWNFRSQNVSWCLRKIIFFFLTYFPFSRIKRLLSLINQKVFKICHIFGIQTTAMYFFIIRSLWIMHPTIGSWVHYPKEISYQILCTYRFQYLLILIQAAMNERRITGIKPKKYSNNIYFKFFFKLTHILGKKNHQNKI